MKYIDADLLRKKIEKLKKEYDARVSSTLMSEGLVYMGKVEAINKALCIIDSLQQEQQEEPDKDLEKEIARYCQSYYNCIYPKQLKEGNCWVGMPHIVEAARYFAKWQKERGTFMGPIHEKCSQCPYDRDVVFWKGMQHAIAGMKKDAVEGIYTKSMDGENVFVESGALKIDPASVNVGDKVKLIIIKDDGKSD
jgi:hypothetical protein